MDKLEDLSFWSAEVKAELSQPLTMALTHPVHGEHPIDGNFTLLLVPKFIVGFLIPDSLARIKISRQHENSAKLRIHIL
jgi:hypothetical protein